jgi:hypothetical protein
MLCAGCAAAVSGLRTNYACRQQMLTEMRNCFIERRVSFIFAANARGNSRTAARPTQNAGAPSNTSTQASAAGNGESPLLKRCLFVALTGLNL